MLSGIGFTVLKIALFLQSVRSVQITVYSFGTSSGLEGAVGSGGNSGEKRKAVCW